MIKMITNDIGPPPTLRRTGAPLPRIHTDTVDSIELSSSVTRDMESTSAMMERVAEIRRQLAAGTYNAGDKMDAILGEIESEIHAPERATRYA